MTTPTDPYSRPGDNEDNHDDFLKPLGDEPADGEHESVFREDPSTIGEDHREDHGDHHHDGEHHDGERHEDFAADGEPVFEDGNDFVAPEHEDRGEFGQADHGADEPVFSHDEARDDLDHDVSEADRGHDDDRVERRDRADHDDWDRQFGGDVQDNSAPQGDENHTVAGNATMSGDSLESTGAWEPTFNDEDKTEQAHAPRDERGFAGFLPGERSAEEAEEPTVVEERPAARSESPTRTSVFNRPVEDNDATTVAPVAGGLAAGGAAATQTRTGETTSSAPSPYSAPQTETRPVRDENLFVPDAPAGRGWAHVGVFLATLVLAPFAWYLVSDAGVRLGVLSDSQWSTGNTDWMSVLELIGALACLGVLWYIASYSSVGAIFFGLIIFVAGMIGVVAPAFAQDLLNSSAMQSFGDFNAFTGNVVYHLTNDIATGRFAVYGFLLLATGAVSHWARRHGQGRGRIEGERGALLRNR